MKRAGQKPDLALKQYSHADSCTNNQIFKTSRQGVGDHGPDSTGRKVKPSHFRRPVESRFKLLFEPHAFMERTDRRAIMLQGARLGYRPDKHCNFAWCGLTSIQALRLEKVRVRVARAVVRCPGGSRSQVYKTLACPHWRPFKHSHTGRGHTLAPSGGIRTASLTGVD